VCGHCGTPLTACWTKGKYSRFPYYLCPKKGCESYGKSIRRATIEGEFETLLHDLRPAPELFSVARAMFEDLWNNRLTLAKANRSSLTSQLAKVERDIERFLDRIAQAEPLSVITVYENRISRLEERKIRSARRSPIAAVRYAASTRHLELRSTSSQTPAISGLQTAWSARKRCSNSHSPTG
jgi:hypothetical protein